MMWLLLLACAGETPKYPAVAEALMARADQDGDGAIDAAEYALLARADEPMATCDGNGDGSIDVVELEDCFLTVNPTRLQAERRREWMTANGEGSPGGDAPSGKAGGKSGGKYGGKSGGARPGGKAGQRGRR